MFHLQAFLFLTLFSFSVAISESLNGYVTSQSLDNPAILSVIAVSSFGQIVSQAPVTSQGNFTLYAFLAQTGYFTLYLLGAVRQEYPPVLVHVESGNLTAAYPRLDPLSVPQKVNPSGQPISVYFSPVREAVFAPRREPWRLRHIWRYKVRFLQLLAVLFVVWFPRVIRELPQDLREELTGEKEPDIGDPNKVVKALLGQEAASTGTQEQRQSR